MAADRETGSGVERLALHRIHGVLPRRYHMKYRSGQEALVEEQSLKEVEEQIRAAGASLEIPDGLLPENMDRRLEQVYLRQCQRKKTVAVCMGCAIILVVIMLLCGVLF